MIIFDDVLMPYPEYDGVLAGGGDGTVNNVIIALNRKVTRIAGKEEDANKENPSLVKPEIAVGTLPVSRFNSRFNVLTWCEFFASCIHVFTFQLAS